MSSNDNRIDEIRERRAKITPTPWKANGLVIASVHKLPDGSRVADCESYVDGEYKAADNVDFIVHAPEDIDYLLAEIDRVFSLYPYLKESYRRDTKMREQVERSERTPVEEIIKRLEMVGSGAHVHTANKAKYYLEYFQTHDAERFYFGYDRLRDLKVSALNALEDGEWFTLTQHMKSWQ